VSYVTRATLSSIAAARWLSVVSRATLPLIGTTFIKTCLGAIRHAHLPVRQRFRPLRSHKTVPNVGSDKQVNKQKMAEPEKKDPRRAGLSGKELLILLLWSPRVAKLAYNVFPKLGWVESAP